MSQLIDLLTRLIRNAQQQWNTLVKYIDGPTARMLIIALTLLMIFEVMWFSMVLTLYLVTR